MSDFASYAQIAAHAADRLEKLRDETGRHGWTVQSKKTAIDYFATKYVTAIAMMLKTSPYLVRWREIDLATVVRLASAETEVIPLPGDHRPLIEFMRQEGFTCFIVKPPAPAS